MPSNRILGNQDLATSANEVNEDDYCKSISTSHCHNTGLILLYCLNILFVFRKDNKVQQEDISL